MNIILLGIQGSGKGTLVADLENYLDFNLISVGQLLRDEVATGSELGKHINELQTAGLLVDLPIVVDVINKSLKSSNKDITIFDGFPRDKAQADALDKIANVDMAIYLNLSKEEAVNRVINRLNCSGCGLITSKKRVSSDVCPQCGGKLVQRSDDTIEGITKRIEVYLSETFPLVDRYRERGVLVEVDADREPKAILNDVLEILKVINEHKD